MSLVSLKWVGFGGAGIPDRLPQALAELQGYTITGPLAGVGANTPIAIPGMDLGDTIQKVLLFIAGVPSDITSNASIVDRRATGTLTLSGVVAGDKVSVNGKTYTAVILASAGFANAVGPYQFVVGASDAATAANLMVAINSGDSSLVVTSSTNVVTVVNRVLGSVGNAVTLGVTLSNSHVTASGATLAGGSDTQSINISSSTTGNLVLIFWYNNPLFG